MDLKRADSKKTRAPTTSVGVLCGIALLILASSQPITGSDELFVPLMCRADTTVGLHDAHEEDDVQETYEARMFNTSTFTLVENRTFRDLLADEDVDLYLTLRDGQTKVTFEYSCRKIRGWNQRQGYSCANSPPTEILAIDPKTLRFSRASVGAWTFYTANDLSDSAVLFVEKGVCVHNTKSNEPSETDKQAD